MNRFGRSPRVAPASQPWAGGWNPFRILPEANGVPLQSTNSSLAARLTWRLALGAYLVLGAWCLELPTHAADAVAEVKNATFTSGEGGGRIVIEATLKGMADDPAKVIFASAIQHTMRVGLEKISHVARVQIEIIQGEPKEIPLLITGDGEVKQVTGEGLFDWSVRRQADGARALVLRPKKSERVQTNLVVMVGAETELDTLPKSLTPFTLSSTPAALSQGYVRIETDPVVSVKALNPTGVIAMETKYLPEAMRAATSSDDEPLAFRFQGAGYTLPLQITTSDPEARRVTLANFKLGAQLTDDSAVFTLTALARVKHPKGGTIELLSGAVALTGVGDDAGAPPLGAPASRRLEGVGELAGGTPALPVKWRMKFQDGRFFAVFDEPGEYPIRLRFHAAVRHADNWHSLDLRVAASALQPLALAGLPADTQFRFAGGAKPERKGSEFVTFLPADGAVQLSWKTSRPESEGKLFYSAEMLAQISVAPGLMRQTTLIEGRVMQGELTRLAFTLTGEGEVTRVLGEQVLKWEFEPLPNSNFRRLVVQFNQPQKDFFAVQVQMQTPLAAFPAAFNAMRLTPDNATRFAGYYRVVNDGAVRLEVVNATGLSQVSPEQFPESDVTRALLRTEARQRFVHRFSGANHTLRVAADNVLPEISLSQLIAYHLAETETAMDAELELDIREAPVRELLLNVPKGYALARITAAGLADYFLKDQANDAQLRLVYAAPVSGRQIVQLRLERNTALGTPTWALPRIEVPQAKSVRGHIAVSADAGFRVTPETTVGLTEIATAFFPRKVNGIQSALRLSEAAWQATMRVERLPQSITVDAFHLFSIGERIAYGSSVINYQISGAPIGTLRVELTNEYFNIEFLGKDVRDWQKTNGGFEIHLHTPVSGAYTLLATYERPFRGQGDTLAFTGARPLDAQSEQGHTIAVSANQFQVRPANISAGLLALEPAEVPAEYRLFFDAPILAAYRYNARPFNLQLVLSPLAQGDTLNQVADRAALETRISKQGQVVTSAKYFVKNRGQPNFQLTLPPGTELWAATVNGVTAVPTLDGQAHLIPLPGRADPDAISIVELKLASRSAKPERVSVAAPIVGAPVLLAEWKILPDAGQRLVFRDGTLAPAQGFVDGTGFAALARLVTTLSALFPLLVSLTLLLVGLAVWHWSARAGVFKFSAQHVLGTLLGVVALVVGAVTLLNVATLAGRVSAPPGTLSFVAPIQQAGNAMQIEVANLEDKPSVLGVVSAAWPALLALPLLLVALINENSRRTLALVAAWTLLFWAALRSPNGVLAFFLLLVAFVALHLALPMLKRLVQLPMRPKETLPPDAATPLVVPLILTALLLAQWPAQAATLPASRSIAPVAESVQQQVRVEDKFAFATVKIRWSALKDQRLPVLSSPAVLTRTSFPTNALKWIENPTGNGRRHELLALQDGVFNIEFDYQLQPGARGGESGFTLPTHGGLVNELALTLVNLDVDVIAPSAVSIQDMGSTGYQPVPSGNLPDGTGVTPRVKPDAVVPRDAATIPVGGSPTGAGRLPAPPMSNTVAKLILPPVNDAWIGWKPRSRDTKREKAVFYAELAQLYIPSAGVIEGQHLAQIRPAQGELNELIFCVPTNATITDVIDITTTNRPGMVALWRFDPDARQLRVTLKPAQARPFSLVIRSQTAAGPLPVTQRVGLLSLTNAASEIGMVGFATGPDVQLDNATPDALTVINLEDFQSWLLNRAQSQMSGLTLRRAFRYSDANAGAVLVASAVEPDVRVDAQQTLSLGEDRTLLAANLAVEITRAGIFRLSFALPAGLDVESISGAAVSHWTELKTDTNRIITLHLRGKTEGAQPLSISLAGPGVKATNGWAVPRLLLREAGKQRGQLVIVPEQGMRLQPGTRDGLTQLDPQKSGIRQKGVLAFRLLQDQWVLALDMEQVDPWVQVQSLQHVAVGEAQSKVTANLQYQIENTGLKALRVLVPTNAEGVQFRGEQVADFLPRVGAITNGLQEWEIKLHRRVIGAYLLQVTYQTPTPGVLTLRGLEAAGVNLQRGYVTIESVGRLQVEIGALPSALQLSEWQSVPRALRQDLQTTAANVTFRLVEPAFQLPLQARRHEVAKLLPARVNHVLLKSVVSDDGMMLTHARLDLVPGDKRLLELTLPEKAKFWFAFVNQNGVVPWLGQSAASVALAGGGVTNRQRDAGGTLTGKILLPLEQQSKPDEAIAVEFFFSSAVGGAKGRAFDLQLLGPKFDLPLEDITWQVFLNDKRELRDWDGTLQLNEARTTAGGSWADLNSYLQQETAARNAKTKVAEQQLQLGNSFLSQGTPQLARQAFQNAYGLSQHDQAFNEDARVQLHNVKMQQALIGLNVRQAANAPAAGVAAKVRELRQRRDGNYSQDEAKQIFDNNSADDNNALSRLASRLIQQQEAAVAAPAAIRAAVPEQGRVLTFKRAVQVDQWAEMRVDLETKAVRGAPLGTRFLVLLGLAALLGISLLWRGRAADGGA